MTTLEALILGIIQGITEFLPVSSSGHLKLAQYFLGLQDLDHYILFDLACHLGTLLAIVVVFFCSIKELFGSNVRRLGQLMLATLPLFPLVAVMKPIKALYADPRYLGFFFLLTAFILFLGIAFAKRTSQPKPQKSQWRDALIIGTWQAFAILPGVSRSASTITGARLLGWEMREAIAFSFLLAIPTILGGTTLELLKLWQDHGNIGNASLQHYAVGFSVSFLVGAAALQLLIKIATHNKFYYFAWYCLFLGLATILYFQLPK